MTTSEKKALEEIRTHFPEMEGFVHYCEQKLVRRFDIITVVTIIVLTIICLLIHVN